jgi:hypothetical protein
MHGERCKQDLLLKWCFLLHTTKGDQIESLGDSEIAQRCELQDPLLFLLAEGASILYWKLLHPAGITPIDLEIQRCKLRVADSSAGREGKVRFNIHSGMCLIRCIRAVCPCPLS